MGMTDVALLKLAASGDMDACSFIKDHNTYYACTGKYWERGDCSYQRLTGEKVSECFTELASKSKDSHFCYSVPDVTKRIDCIYNVDYGMTYENYLKSQVSNTSSTAESERPRALELLNSDFSSCYTLPFSPYCLFLSVKNGEQKKLVEQYKKSTTDDSWPFWLVLYDYIRIAKRGGDCTTFSYEGSLASGYFARQQLNENYFGYAQKICEAIVSNDEAVCSGIEAEDLPSICFAFLKKSTAECGEDNVCAYYFKTGNLI
jgi:hypothetical protein